VSLRALGIQKHSTSLTARRHNKKQVDLSLTFRLSGLPSGAQLELVQSSRTATAINVALQLPDNQRLTEKFSSTTSIWQILRAFESGAAGGTGSTGPSNFTQRGIAKQENGNPGAGRLYYETPVVNVMGRELASFVDLQKSLVQLGVTSGSALLRLSFRGTNQPLEEAMTQISEYFKSSGADGEAEAPKANQPAPQPDVASSTAETFVPRDTAPSEQTLEAEIGGQQQRDTEPEKTQASSNQPQSDTVTPPPPMNTATQRPLKVFLPPTTSTPSAASLPFNENDYVPTIEHARIHQARLSNSGRNQRLLSDKELADQEAERQARLSAVNQVKVRIRFPDQTTVETIFGKDDRGQDVYGMVRDVIASSNERFSLTYVGLKGGHLVLRDGPQRLVADDGWKGSMLINFTWDQDVSAEVKKHPVLKAEVSRQAVPLKVDAPKFEDEPEQKPEKSSGWSLGQGGKDPDRQKSMEAKLKGFLGIGKKK
jgi:tether containing UBX domain for GLUT4